MRTDRSGGSSKHQAAPAHPRRGRIVAIGECMLELARTGNRWQVGYGGDTFNTALYMARLGENVSYLTAIGDDPFSNEMRLAWQEEGLHLDLALLAPARLPGLYAIRTDEGGERSFHYWRQDAAVRNLFNLPGSAAAIAVAATADLLYLSGITLALFDLADREKLYTIAAAVRARGGEVAFDPNYRPQMWAAPEQARAAIAAIAPFVTTVLPTFADEAALHGDRDPEITLARWTGDGAREVVVKLGAAGCMLGDGRIVATLAAAKVVDTTGAGDAFNAAYLTTRRAGSTVKEAADDANMLAGRVIEHVGAVMPMLAMQDLTGSATVR